MIGGLFRRSLFKLDLGMEGKTVFCGIVNNIVNYTNQTHTISVDSSKIHTAHLIYYLDGLGNVIIYNSGSYTYPTSFDIVLNSGKSTYFCKNLSSSSGTGFRSDSQSNSSPYGLIHNGSTITLKYAYYNTDNQASSDTLILLIIKEHDVIM